MLTGPTTWFTKEFYYFLLIQMCHFVLTFSYHATLSLAISAILFNGLNIRGYHNMIFHGISLLI